MLMCHMSICLCVCLCVRWAKKKKNQNFQTIYMVKIWHLILILGYVKTARDINNGQYPCL